MLTGLLVGVAIALGGCSLESFKTEAAQVPRLVYSELSDPSTFNAVTNSAVTSVFGLLYEPLLKQNGLTGELEPAIAESWDISPDQKRITFTLRPGLQWSDGEPLTVEDVDFSFNQVWFNDDIPSGERDILRVGQEGVFPTVRVVGDRQVEFSVPEPFAPLLRYAGGITILPKHALEQYVTTRDAEGQPQFLSAWNVDTPVNQIIGNGPYRLAGYRTSERILFERNPHYWRKDAQGKAQPYVERFVIELVESTETALLQFRSGGLDSIGISPDYFALLKREENRGGFTIYNGGPALSTTFITFNLNQGRRNGQPLVDPIKSRWFNTVQFRQAVAFGIDRQTMINNIYQGLGQPQNSSIAIQSPYYLTPAAGLPTYDYNPDQAKRLLQEAGFQYDPSGALFDRDGNRVRFTLLTNSGNKIRESMGAQIKRDLAKIGIQVDFQPIAFNTLIDRTSNTLDWDSFILGFGGSGVEPDGSRNVWSPEGQLHSFNQKAFSGDPVEGRVIADWEQEIYQLYVQGSQELDEEKRKAIYARAQILAQEHLPFIHLVNPYSLVAIRDRVQNVKFSALGGSLWNVHELQVSP